MSRLHFDDLTGRVRRYIEQHRLIPAGSLIIAAVSGGADSLSLLLFLHALIQDLHFDLAVLHVHHGLRGPEADEDLLFVKTWSERLDVPFYTRRIDVAAIAGHKAIGLELAGRQARMDCFADLVTELNNKSSGHPSRPVRVALAHHRDDQAETLLMHLGRGSGLDGLAGMKPSDGFLIRPLLELSRSQIEAWLLDRQITWRQDASNAEGFTIRNRLRLQVLPVWKRALGYDPAPLLCRTAENLASDRELLDQLAEDAFARITLSNREQDEPACVQAEHKPGIEAGPYGPDRRDENEPVSLDRARFHRLHPALQNRVIRSLWQQATGSGRDLAAIHLKLILAFLQTAERDQTLDLPGNWQVIARPAAFGVIRSNRGKAKITAKAVPAVLLNLPGVTYLPQLSIFITADFIENEKDIVYNSAMESFWLNKIEPCVLRTKQPGDRIHPIGRKAGKTLKKFLNEQAVNAEDRGNLPLLACGSEIVWLPGLAAGEYFAARPGDGGSGTIVRLAVHVLLPDSRDDGITAHDSQSCCGKL